MNGGHTVEVLPCSQHKTRFQITANGCPSYREEIISQLPASDMVEIEVWGEARDAAIQLLESLSLPLTKPLGEALLERTV
jgi:hypothetical protein